MTRLFNKETPRSHMNLSELLKELEEKEAIRLKPVNTETSDWFNFDDVVANEEEKEAKAYDDILEHLHELTVQSMEDLIVDIENMIGNSLTPPKTKVSVPFETPEDNLGKGGHTYKQGELQDNGSVSYENEPTITIHLDTDDFDEKIDKLINSLKEIKADETFDNLFGKALSPKPISEQLRLHEQLDKKRLDKIESDIYNIKNEIESNKIATNNDTRVIKNELTNAVRDIATNTSDIALLKEYVL